MIDLKRVQNLKVLVALRTNIFSQLNFGSRTGGQEEKFRSNMINVKWSPKDLESLLSTRARAAGRSYATDHIRGIQDLLPSSNKTRGNPLNYILKRTLMRPRDAIAFINQCYTRAGGRTQLSWDDIHSSELAYSENRLLALRDEWKPTFPGIEAIFEVFELASEVMSRKEYGALLDDVALLLADQDFAGIEWLTKLTESIWNSNDSDAWESVYFPLTQLLYDIGFIGCNRPNTSTFFYSCDQPGYLAKPTSLRHIESFTVHAAFRPTLNIQGSGGEPGRLSEGSGSDG